MPSPPEACSAGSRSGLGRSREHGPGAGVVVVRDPFAGPRRPEPVRPAGVLGWVDRASPIRARGVVVVRDPICSPGPRRREPVRPARVLGWVGRASTIRARGVVVAFVIPCPRRWKPRRPARVLGWVDRASTIRARGVVIAFVIPSVRRPEPVRRLRLWAGPIGRARSVRRVSPLFVIRSAGPRRRESRRPDTVRARRVVVALAFVMLVARASSRA